MAAGGSGGALLAAPCADFLGRKKSMILFGLLFIIGATMQVRTQIESCISLVTTPRDPTTDSGPLLTRDHPLTPLFFPRKSPISAFSMPVGSLEAWLLEA